MNPMRCPMKNKNLILSLVIMLGIGVLGVNHAYAANAAPVIFYSDLTAGPNTGGQNNNGVFVTVWGNNFGSSQGTSYITVGGGQVSTYLTWTNTMICFQLGSNVTTGNIILVSSNGNATGPAFTVQAGNIYFVDPKAASNGSGTFASPFNHLYYFENIANPGDTVYVRSGTIYNEVNGYPGWHSIVCPTRGGSQGKPVSWIAYPNETVTLQADGGTATWTDGSSGGSDGIQYIFRERTDWHTISKFTMVMSGNGGTSVIDSTGSNGWKVVGNNITASTYLYAIVALGGNYSQVLGNEIHNSGNSNFSNMNHSIYWDGGGSNVEIGWNYLHDNKNAGWEISCFHQGTRVGSIHDNLITNAGGYPLKGILLGDVDNGEDQTTERASVYNVYNNVLYNLGYYEYGGAIQAVSGTGYIYNNTIYQNGTETMGTVQFPSGGTGPGGGHPVWYFANNIIYNSSSNALYLSDGNGGSPAWTNFALLTNNNYYGAGNGPSQSLNSLNANPLFVSNGSNFHLQATSPDISVGYDTTSIVTIDLDGNTRPQGSGISIGAYQYGGSVLPGLPVVTITSPGSGNSFAYGSNVTFTATASEVNGTIANVTFYYNGAIFVGTDFAAPYTYTVTNVLAGTYTLTAVATDANGVTTTSSPVTFTVSDPVLLRTPPVVAITSPTSGNTYTAGSNLTITTTASETNGTISNISLYNGAGVLLGSSNVSPYNYVYSNLLAGNYSFYAIATDTSGVSTTSSAITATVTAPASPVVAITSPLNGCNFVAGTTVTISAAASEVNGSISSVKFYDNNGTNFLGTSTTAPYNYVGNNAPAGTYTITAVATDAVGISTTSSPVTITIASSLAPSITIQPANMTVTASTGASFNIAATGVPSPTYQWKKKASGSSSYSSISGATSATYTVSSTTTSMSGTQYECVVTNSAGSVTSSAATLTVNSSTVAPSITSQPVSMTVTAAAVASFSVAATGTPAPTYQWMQSVNGGAFTAISGATSATYTIASTTTSMSGTQYKCVVTN